MGQIEDEMRGMIEFRYGNISKFARKIGLSPQTVHSALRNGITGASVNTVMPIVAELGISPEWLVKNQIIECSHDDQDFYDAPLYGSIAAGTPIEMIPVSETHPIPAPLHEMYPESFLLTVKGESMNRILPNGSYALVNPCLTVEHPGKPYAVCVNGFEATIKRVKPLNNGYELVPDSTDPTFKPVVYDYSVPGTEQISIIGLVVWYCIPYVWRF